MSYDMLAFDEGVRKVVEASSIDYLDQGKLVSFEQPSRHVTPPILDGESEAVFSVAILYQRVHAADSDQVLDDVLVACICRNVNGLAATRCRLDAAVEAVLLK